MFFSERSLSSGRWEGPSTHSGLPLPGSQGSTSLRCGLCLFLGLAVLLLTGTFKPRKLTFSSKSCHSLSETWAGSGLPYLSVLYGASSLDFTERPAFQGPPSCRDGSSPSSIVLSGCGVGVLEAAYMMCSLCENSQCCTLICVPLYILVK